jgi:biopolymer transport protein ExbD
MHRSVVLALAMLACRSQPVTAAPIVDASVVAPTPPPAPLTAGDPLTVVVSKTQLIADDTSLAPMPLTREQAVSRGFEAQYKDAVGGIDPLTKAAQRKRANDLDAGHYTEAIVICERTTPYRIFSEVVTTLGHVGITKLHLMVLMNAKDDAGAPTSSKPSTLGALPSLPPHPAGKPLQLKVSISEHGIVFTTTDGSFGSGCKLGGSGITVPMIGTRLDEEAIRRCASAIHSSAPISHDVSIGADQAVPYEMLLPVMDALKQDDSGAELFSDVSFAPVH